jgi:hypothetical protein
MSAPEDQSRPYVPGEPDPIVIVPTGTHLGHCRIPTVRSESGEQGAIAVPRVTFDTVVGAFTIAQSREAWVDFLKAFSKLLGLQEPTELAIARSADVDGEARRHGFGRHPGR